MAAGNQATRQTIDSTLSSFTVQLRELMEAIAKQQAFVVKLGLTGLEGLASSGGPPSYTAAEAQAVLDAFNHMGTIVGVYMGTVQQGGTGGTGATLFNFEDSLTPYWAGQ